MSETTNIEWADSTFNPWMGCTKVSPACDHCYAERDTKRFGRVEWGAGKPRVRTSPANWKLPERWNRTQFYQCGLDCKWRGEMPKDSGGNCPVCKTPYSLFIESAKARRRVFCASLADWLDNEVPIEWLVDLLDLIRRTPNLDWLLLTKRIGNWRGRLTLAMESLLAGDSCGTKECYDQVRWNEAWLNDRPPANVWIGSTMIDRAEMLRDAEKLAHVSAAVRFWSIEPMLGDFGVIPAHLMPNWIIAGGESGPHARPMHPNWVRSLRDQCEAAGVPFLFKQHGEWLATDFCSDEDVMLPSRRTVYINRDGSYVDGTEGFDFFAGFKETAWVGKKAAGRKLDGRTHDGFPVVKP